MEDVVSVIATALARPTTYVGHLREAMSLATCMARYPLGFFDAPLVPTGAGSYIDRAVHQTPVLLVHGYGHNRSAWYVIERHLRNAGFANVYTVNYNPLRHSVGTLAAQLGRRVEMVRSASGAERVHVIGHSLGGIMLRWYVQELGDLAAFDQLAFTLATPEFEPVELSPVCPLGTSSVVAGISQHLAVTTVRNTEVVSDATNVLARDHGHMSMLLSSFVARTVTAQLEAAEGAPGMGTLRSLPQAGEEAVPAAAQAAFPPMAPPMAGM